MKKLMLAVLSVLLLSSCGVSDTLYNWGGRQNGTTAYENLAYQSYDKQTPKSVCNLVAVYEEMVTKPGGLRQVPPPGICAEYGYLLLQPQTAEVFQNNATAYQKQMFDTTDYATLFQEKGKALLEQEMVLYPESIKFIQPLLKKLVR